MNLIEACEKYGVSIDSIQCTPEILAAIKNKAEEVEPFFDYYEIENSISEWNSMVSARFKEFEQAKDDMKNHADWWSDSGTGEIYHVIGTVNKVTGAVNIKREKVFKK